MRPGLLPLAIGVLGALAVTPPALAQFDANLVPKYTIWDIRFGEPISQVPAAEIAEIACGTNGGPPSTPLKSFSEFEKCPAEASGLHEVYFTNDDEADYIARALETEYRVMQGGNSIYAHPVVFSVLIDAGGIARGIRVVTDERAADRERRVAMTLSRNLKSRYGRWAQTCEDLPPTDGQLPVGKIFVHEICTADSPDAARSHLFPQEGADLDQPRDAADQQELFPVGDPARSGAEAVRAGYEAGAMRARGGRMRRMVVLALLLLAPGAALASPADELRSGARRECRGCDLSNESFKKLDLSGVDLSGANLPNASFHRANLTGAKRAGVMAEGANFNLADLSRADLSGGRFKDAMFYEAQLSGAKFGQADLTATRMQHARLTGADLSGADLDWAVMKEVRLNNADLTGASLERTNLEKASLGRTRFDGTTITSAGFLQATAPGASFKDAKVSLTDFYGAALDNVDFTGAVLSDNRFTRARLKLEQFAAATYTRNILPDGRVQGAQ